MTESWPVLRVGTSLTGALWTYLDNSDKTWVCNECEIAEV